MVRGENLGFSLTLLGWPFLASLISVGAVAIGLVSLPYHDIMVETEYWWECLVLQCNVWMVTSALLYATNTPAMMNLEHLYTWWKSFGITYVAGYIFGYVFSWSVTTMIWVYVFGLRYPIPLGGIVNQILGLFFMILSLWFQMPKAWRMVASFKKRAKWVILFHLIGVAISALYWVLWVIMAYVPADYQPVMAVVIPLFREGLVEILQMTGVFSVQKCFKLVLTLHLVPLKLLVVLEKRMPLLSSRWSTMKARVRVLYFQKYTNHPSILSFNLQVGHFISQFHVLFLSVALGSLATQPTTYLLLGTRSLYH